MAAAIVVTYHADFRGDERFVVHQVATVISDRHAEDCVGYNMDRS